MELSRERIETFQREVFDWFREHGRDLPWRHTRDPYRILVSEIMLQQTQVERVIPKYAAFLREFDSVSDLARATTAQVLRAWRGLGYNRRALYLHRAAQEVHTRYAGTFPCDLEALEALPGVGRYTARAVACFAFGAQVAVVDTNVRRVLTELADPNREREFSPREVEALADSVLPPGRAWEWNQALMDYGAMVVPRRPALPSTHSSRGPRFEHTNRFWRGRIVDVLRDTEGDVAIPELFYALPNDGRDEQRVRSLVRALHEEGMIQYDLDADAARLPE